MKALLAACAALLVTGTALGQLELPTITLRPDLLVTDFTSAPSTVGVGEVFNAEFKVRNVGTGPASSANFSIIFPRELGYSGIPRRSQGYTCNETLDRTGTQKVVMCTQDATTPPLLPNEYRWASVPLKATLTVSTFQIKTLADPTSVIEEDSEYNNAAMISVSSYVRPQLKMVCTCPSTGKFGMSSIIDCTASNVGTTTVRYPSISFSFTGVPDYYINTLSRRADLQSVPIVPESAYLYWSYTPPEAMQPAPDKSGILRFLIGVVSTKTTELEFVTSIAAPNENTFEDNTAKCLLAFAP